LNEESAIGSAHSGVLVEHGYPKQLVAFLQDQNTCLAPVFRDDKLVVLGAGVRKITSKKIDALLA
jgi:hypothetical protein